MFFAAETRINIQTVILLTSKSLLLFASWDSLSSYFAGEKVWRCSSFSSVSSLAWFVVVECRENVRPFSASSERLFLSSWLLDSYTSISSAWQWNLSSSNVDAFSFPSPRRKSVILVLWKVADVFKLNDEKRSHFLIDEIFQVAMFLQWNLIVEHPKIF